MRSPLGTAARPSHRARPGRWPSGRQEGAPTRGYGQGHLRPSTPSALRRAQGHVEGRRAVRRDDRRRQSRGSAARGPASPSSSTHLHRGAEQDEDAGEYAEEAADRRSRCPPSSPHGVAMRAKRWAAGRCGAGDRDGRTWRSTRAHATRRHRVQRPYPAPDGHRSPHQGSLPPAARHGAGYAVTGKIRDQLEHLAAHHPGHPRFSRYAAERGADAPERDRAPRRRIADDGTTAALPYRHQTEGAIGREAESSTGRHAVRKLSTDRRPPSTRTRHNCSHDNCPQDGVGRSAGRKSW